MQRASASISSRVNRKAHATCHVQSIIETGWLLEIIQPLQSFQTELFRRPTAVHDSWQDLNWHSVLTRSLGGSWASWSNRRMRPVVVVAVTVVTTTLSTVFRNVTVWYPSREDTPGLRCLCCRAHSESESQTCIVNDLPISHVDSGPLHVRRLFRRASKTSACLPGGRETIRPARCCHATRRMHLKQACWTSLVGQKFSRPSCHMQPTTHATAAKQLNCRRQISIDSRRYAAQAAVDLPATEHSSKPAARCCCHRSSGQTDGQTGGRTLDRFNMRSAYYMRIA